MAPKRPAKSPATQRTIASFFSPPQKRKAEVIEVSDSDDDVVAIGPVKKPRLENGGMTMGDLTVERKGASVQDAEPAEVRKPEGDEALARRLAAQWEAEDTASQEAKGTLEVKPNDSTTNSPPQKMHPMFGRAQEGGPSRARESKQDLRQEDKPNRKPTLTATRAQPVDPIDFDTDSLFFRPALVDISRWPAGRLPYSVLVGVYVQVASTRSRLTIVRVLTKCVSFSPPA